MDSNAVPFLVKQLAYGRIGVLEIVEKHLRRFPLTNPLVRDLVLPSSRRAYAAVALRRMGAKAESAIPSVLDAWGRDIPEVRINAVSAIESILHGSVSDGLSPAEWRQLESELLAEAAHRFPEAARKAGYKPESSTPGWEIDCSPCFVVS